MNFTGVYLSLEHGYLVPSGSPIKTINDVNRSGIRVGVPAGGSVIAPLQRTLKDAEITLFCTHCSQKMRIIMAIPAQGGRETRTYDCACGPKGLTWPFIDRVSPQRRLLKLPATVSLIPKCAWSTASRYAHENDCSITVATKSTDQALDNPNDKGPS
jgi:hypothetical protein